MSKEELISLVEKGKVRIVPNWQLLIFVITAIFAIGGTYANFNSRITIAENNIIELQVNQKERLERERSTTQVRDKQWYEIQMNMKSICKALNIPYEKIEDVK